MASANKAKNSKLAVRDVAAVPLREVSGLALRGTDLLAVGDRDPVVFTAAIPLGDADGRLPLTWHGIDLAGMKLPDGGVQFEAIASAGPETVLILQEQPARVLCLDLSGPSLLGSLLLDVPHGHPLRDAWLGDSSSRGESLLLTDRGHLIVVKEKNPSAILEFGPAGDTAVGWRRGGPAVPPAAGDQTLTVLATWWPSKRLSKDLPDISDATVGPDGCFYLLSDKGSAIARLPDVLDRAGGTVDAEAVWRIDGWPENAEGLVILDDGTPLVAIDTKAPKDNLLRLEALPLA